MTVFNSRLLDHGLCGNNPGNQPRRAARCAMKPKIRYSIILTTIFGQWSQIKQKAFQKCAVTPTRTLKFDQHVFSFYLCLSIFGVFRSNWNTNGKWVVKRETYQASNKL